MNICTTEVPADENSLDAHWPETWADLWSLGKGKTTTTRMVSVVYLGPDN